MSNEEPSFTDSPRRTVELNDEELDQAAGGVLPDSLKKRPGNVAAREVEKSTRTCPDCKAAIAKADLFCPDATPSCSSVRSPKTPNSVLGSHPSRGYAL